MDFDFFYKLFLDYWEFFFAAGVLSAVMEAVKKVVKAPKSPLNPSLRFYLTKTLPVHPIVLGALLGLAPGIPVPKDMDTLAGHMLYFAGAGLVSTWIYSVAKSWVKKLGASEDDKNAE